ncbi:alpha-hydroxy-acid oxidizing protein [Streptosporangiaceae bacterium NEAU-GS5]|nr:alpha-hydroxy-acid oxidizing protein [Streptosporangiaceae bacterium NEAU-GS5]
MTLLTAAEFPQDEVRLRARTGSAAVFPPVADYGSAVYGQPPAAASGDRLDHMRLVPPIFTPERLAKLVELGREPSYQDVALETDIGGLRSTLPLYVSALGSTTAAARIGAAVARQAACLGVPMVIGENVAAADGYRTRDGARSLAQRVETYLAAEKRGLGGVVVQQSTEDADAELWNRIYSDPATRPLLDSGRLAFELKLGQGAKPGLGGMTMVNGTDGARLAGRYLVDSDVDLDVDPDVGADGGAATGLLRSSTPGTFTQEILRAQIRLLRNNFPRARIWIKLPPTRDVGEAARLAWAEGADAVTVDGAEAGTGWAPTSFLQHVGLPLADCLGRVRPGSRCLLVSGRMWEGARAVKCMALGARAVGLGRAALLAVDESDADGLVRLVRCLELEMRLLISALGRYRPGALSAEDIWPHPGEGPVQDGGAS